MEERKYIRTNDGDIIESNENGQRLFEILNNGDLLKIQFYSVRYGKRVTRLFEVEIRAEDKHLIVLSNSYCEFIVYNQEFAPHDQEYAPVILSIIPREKLDTIEQQLSSDEPVLK